VSEFSATFVNGVLPRQAGVIGSSKIMPIAYRPYHPLHLGKAPQPPNKAGRKVIDRIVSPKDRKAISGHSGREKAGRKSNWPAPNSAGVHRFCKDSFSGEGKEKSELPCATLSWRKKARPLSP